MQPGKGAGRNNKSRRKERGAGDREKPAKGFRGFREPSNEPKLRVGLKTLSPERAPSFQRPSACGRCSGRTPGSAALVLRAPLATSGNRDKYLPLAVSHLFKHFTYIYSFNLCNKFCEEAALLLFFFLIH